MVCAPSVLLSKDVPDRSSSYADEGSAAHAVAAGALEQGRDAGFFVGCFYIPEDRVLSLVDNGTGVEVTSDMATDVQVYLDSIRTYAEGHEMRVECRVDLSRHLGVPDQFGTSDVIILTADGEELQVHDLKFGRGVRVDAEHNEQLLLYALGAYDEVSLGANIKRVRVVIHQPRLGHLSEWDLPVAELLEFGRKANNAATKAIDILETGVYGDEELVVSDDGCRFCKAKATCPKLQTFVQQNVGADFEELAVADAWAPKPHTHASLSTAMKATDLIEGWCKAVRAEVERRLLVNEAVEGYKLVKGRQGNRQWSNDAEVEKLFKDTFRLKLDEMYAFKLLSPPAIEKRLKPWTDAEGNTREPVLGPRQKAKMEALVVRPEGGISVAPDSDPRPAYAATPVVFDNLEGDLG
jgi:hypothetical protein